MRNAASRLPLLVALLVAAASLGCAAESEERPEAWSQATSEAPLSEEPLGCAEEAQRECVIVIEQASGVRSCWKGVQFCVDGAWSDCLVESNEPSPG